MYSGTFFILLDCEDLEQATAGRRKHCRPRRKINNNK